MKAHRLRTPNASVQDIAPDAVTALRNVEAYLRRCGLDHKLLDLVKMRASQINGCAFCLDMHSKDLRRLGESEQRLYLLDAWRESPLFDARERAALAWTEAVTRIADTRAPDDVFEQLRGEFNDKEIVDLTTAIGMINLWNRLMIALRCDHPVSAVT
jgi:AhpD family alkylhydroperoxidase